MSTDLLRLPDLDTVTLLEAEVGPPLCEVYPEICTDTPATWAHRCEVEGCSFIAYACDACYLRSEAALAFATMLGFKVACHSCETPDPPGRWLPL